MESQRFLIAFLLFLILSEINGATLRSNEQFQLNEGIDGQDSLDLLHHLEQELEHHTGKEKRCSIFKTSNLQSSLDLKLRLEEQKLANLCKFCNKLESRKNLEICKKCFNNIQVNDILLGNSKNIINNPENKQNNSNETNITFENKSNKSNENKEEKQKNLKEINNTQRTNDDIAVARNSNITKSDVSTLIKSTSSRGSLETLKTQTITGNGDMNMDDDSTRKTLELKENNSIKGVKGTSLSGHLSNSDEDENLRNHVSMNTNLQNKNFHHTETNQQNLINRRLKRKKQLKKSEETTHEDNELSNKQKTELLNENSSKIFDVASDETFENFDDFIELIQDIKTTTEAPKRKIPSGLKISELRMRLANLRAKQNKRQPKIEKNITTTELPTTVYKKNVKEKTQNIEDNKNINDLLEEMKQKRSNILTEQKKLDHEILEENINKKLDEILQILSHNSNKQSMSKEDMKIKLKNILTKNDSSEETKEEDNLQLPLLEETQTEEPSYEYLDQQEDILERIPTNELIKLLNPTTESNEVKQDKKSKLLMKLNIPLNTAFKNQILNKKIFLKNPHSSAKSIPEMSTTQINDFSQEDTNSESNNSEELYDDEDDLLDLLQNAEPTAFEPKIISTRSTNTFKNIKPTYFHPTTEKTLLDKENKMLSIHRNKLTELRNKIHARRQHNLFEKNINMKPEIDEEKYKNFHLTLRNNETKNTETKTLDTSNLEQLLNEHLNSEEQKETGLNIPKKIHFTENKINLPLVLIQNEDGTIEIVLDKSELCSQLNGGKCPYGEKSLCKRKTDENLTKYPLNIFNILKEKKNLSDADKTKEAFYKNIINQKLFELFKSLNIQVDSSQELHSYIDDMPEKQKTELKQYLLNSLSNSQIDFNNIDKDFSERYHTTTENNRLYFKIKSEDKVTPKKSNFLSDIFKNLIHNQIQKELVNTNVCPSCKKDQCFCKNLDKVFFPPDYSSEYSDSASSRILGKRQNKDVDTEDSDNSSDISPHGTVKRRYKIVHNILDWVHDVMIHNNTIV